MRLPRVTLTRELSCRKEEVEDHSGSPPSEDVDPGKDETERVPSEPSVTGWSEVVLISTMASLIRSRRGEDMNHKQERLLSAVTHTGNMWRALPCVGVRSQALNRNRTL